MRSLRWMLGLGLVLASCRSEGGNPPVDSDSGSVDVNAVTDMGVAPTDRVATSDACVPTGPENTPETCADNIDNDCNRFTDCRDFSCSLNNPAVTFCPDAGTSTRDGGRRDSGPCTPSGPENTVAACMDGIDNDCDRFVDCADFNCPQSVCPRDGGATDRPPATDRGTCIPTGPEDTAAACGDGIDNDCNRFIDCNDFACRTCAVPTCAVDGGFQRGDAAVCICSGAGVENTDALCSDGIDNDCDGFRDCVDRSCSRSDGGVSVCPTDAGAARD